MSQPFDADEIIPPSASARKGARPGGAQEKHAAAKIVSRWLDELITIPGTKFRIGLDPFLALVPGIGDVLSNSVSFVVILEAMRSGVALSVIARMALNMVSNALLDMIPGVGAAASAFFKSNSRNLRLLHRWQAGEHHEVKRGSRILLMAIATVCFLALAAVMVVWGFYLWALLKLFGLF